MASNLMTAVFFIQEQIVLKKRDRAATKLENLIKETFKQKIEIISRKDKTMLQRVLLKV